MLIKLHIDKNGSICLNSQVAIENLLQILFLVKEKLFAQDLIGLNDLRKSKESKNINYTENATEREKKVKTNDERERERSQREKKRKERK